MDSNTAEELTREKSLWSVWLVYRNARSQNRLLYMVIASVMGVLVGIETWRSEQTNIDLVANIRSWITDGFNLSVAILGFLLAGFTLIPTLMKPDLALALAQQKHPSSGLSYLKHNMAVFMGVFVEYWLLLCSHFVVRFFGGDTGVVATTVRAMPTSRFVVSLGACLVAMQLTHAVLVLQSFIFNVYHFVMSGVRWEVEPKD